MKSERRHELQHNELAGWLVNTGESLKPYQNAILAGAVIIVVALAGYTMWSRANATRNAQAWAEIASLRPDALLNVADTHPNDPVGQTAAVLLGDLHLAEGCNQRFINSAIAGKELDEAINAYKKVLDKKDSPLLERATFGTARAKEAAFGNSKMKDEKEAQAKTDEIVQDYKTVVTTWPHGAFAAAVKQRLDDFQQTDTKLMLNDLAKYEATANIVDEPRNFGQPSSISSMPNEPPAAPSDLPQEKPEGKTDAKKPNAEPKKK